jgi:hypothetical protein
METEAMTPDLRRFKAAIPLIGGVTVSLDQASPMEIVMEVSKHMPHYAQAVAQHVQSVEAMLGECVNVLRRMGITELRRAPKQAIDPNEGNGGNGGPLGVE